WHCEKPSPSVSAVEQAQVSSIWPLQLSSAELPGPVAGRHEVAPVPQSYVFSGWAKLLASLQSTQPRFSAPDCGMQAPPVPEYASAQLSVVGTLHAGPGS